MAGFKGLDSAGREVRVGSNIPNSHTPASAMVFTDRALTGGRKPGDWCCFLLFQINKAVVKPEVNLIPCSFKSKSAAF